MVVNQLMAHQVEVAADWIEAGLLSPTSRPRNLGLLAGILTGRVEATTTAVFRTVSIAIGNVQEDQDR